MAFLEVLLIVKAEEHKALVQEVCTGHHKGLLNTVASLGLGYERGES
jgi:hypothetical protein